MNNKSELAGHGNPAKPVAETFEFLPQAVAEIPWEHHCKKLSISQQIADQLGNGLLHNWASTRKAAEALARDRG